MYVQQFRNVFAWTGLRRFPSSQVGIIALSILLSPSLIRAASLHNTDGAYIAIILRITVFIVLKHFDRLEARSFIIMS